MIKETKKVLLFLCGQKCIFHFYKFVTSTVNKSIHEMKKKFSYGCGTSKGNP